MASVFDDPQTQYNAMAAMVKQAGAPMTAENFNRASLHMAQGGTGPLLFDQAMERAVASPTPRQARQASAAAGPSMTNTAPPAPSGIVPEGVPAAAAADMTGLLPPGTVPAVLPPQELPTTAPAAPAPMSIAEYAAGVGGDASTDPSINVPLGAGMLAGAAGTIGTAILGRAGRGSRGALLDRLRGTDVPNTAAVAPGPVPDAVPQFGRRTDVATPPPNITVLPPPGTAGRGIPAPPANIAVLPPPGRAELPTQGGNLPRGMNSFRIGQVMDNAAAANPEARRTIFDTQGGKRSLADSVAARRRAATPPQRRRAENE